MAEKERLQYEYQAELLHTEFEVQEQTRKNLAAELHDNIGQLLSLTSVTLASIHLNEPEKATQKLEDTQQLVTRSIKELRQLSKILQGEQLVKQGLKETFEQEIQWLQHHGSYQVEFTENLQELTESNTGKDLFIYRLLQEATNNIIKHALASTIRIRLQFEHPFLKLSIADNGNGFPPRETGTGIGLQNMQRRVALMLGTMEIISEPGKGCTLAFTIPYP